MDNTQQSLRLGTCLLAIVTSVLIAGQSVVYGGELDLSDEVNVKLARQKAKNRQMIHKKAEDYIDGDKKQLLSEKSGDCGSVDIGNISSKKADFGPKKVDVIIVGDVINAGNKC